MSEDLPDDLSDGSWSGIGHVEERTHPPKSPKSSKSPKSPKATNKRRFSIFNVFKSKKSPQALSMDVHDAGDEEEGVFVRSRGGVAGGKGYSGLGDRVSKSADHSPEPSPEPSPKPANKRHSLFNLFMPRKKARERSSSIWHDEELDSYLGSREDDRRASHDDILMSVGSKPSPQLHQTGHGGLRDQESKINHGTSLLDEPDIRPTSYKSGDFCEHLLDGSPPGQTYPGAIPLIPDTKERHDSAPSNTGEEEGGESGAGGGDQLSGRDDRVTIVITPSSSGDLSVTSASASTTTLHGGGKVGGRDTPVTIPEVVGTTSAGEITDNKDKAKEGGLGDKRVQQKTRPRPPPLTLLQMATRPSLSSSVPNLLNKSSPTMTYNRHDDVHGPITQPLGVAPSGGITPDDRGRAVVVGSQDCLPSTVWYDNTHPQRIQHFKKRASSSVDDLLSHVTVTETPPQTPPPEGSASSGSGSSRSASPTKLSPRSAATIMALRRPRAHSDVTAAQAISPLLPRDDGTAAGSDDWAFAYDDLRLASFQSDRTLGGGSQGKVSPKVPNSPLTHKRLFSRFIKKRPSNQPDKTEVTRDDILTNPFLLLPSLENVQNKPPVDDSSDRHKKHSPGTHGPRRKNSASSPGKDGGIVSPLFRRRRAATDAALDSPDVSDGGLVSCPRSPDSPNSPTSPGRTRHANSEQAGLLSPPQPQFGRKRAGSLPNALLAVDFSILTQKVVSGSDQGEETDDLEALPGSGSGKQDKRGLRKLSAILERGFWGEDGDESSDHGRANPKVKDVKAKVKSKPRGSQDFGTTVAMFGRRPHGDVRKSAVKVLDPKKDTVTRLKHLRVVLETYDVQEAKHFFDTNYSHIYYIFYDVFIGVEADLKQRANKAHREELEMVLYIFEKILTLLPELIHKRWQYHSIGRLMKKLLHTGNSIKLRREGMRLFLIWYQVLMENATEECHRTYASLVPKLGSDEGLDMDIFTVNNFSDTDRVTAVEISAMLPAQSGEKQPDDMTKWLLESLLMIMVSEVNKVEWASKEMHEFSFTFLFNKFKQYYLHNIFPDFKNTTIYDPCLDLPQPRRLDELDSARRPLSLAMCQEAVVRWMATFTKKPDAPPLVNPQTSERATEDGEAGPVETEQEGRIVGSNASTLSAASSYTEKDSASSSVCSDDHSVTEYDIVRRVLYSTRENVNIVHEVFRQALLFPFNHSGAIRRVIQVYKDWLQDGQRPPFMLEPVDEDGSSPSSPHPPKALPSSINSDVMGTGACPESPSGVAIPLQNHTVMQIQDGLSDGGSLGSSPSRGSFSVPEHNNRLRNSLVPRDASSAEVTGPVNCRAGIQKVIQVFITNAANIFLLEPSDKDGLLEEQVDLCKRVLNIYRMLVINHQLDQRTWEQLLLVLLHITDGVLTETPPSHRDQSRGGRLAQPLFQTLIVTWIKANLNVYISSELWDQFLHVVSSLTQWVELVKEWAKTMETLTRVLARQVYNLDLNDLPLERQKDKRRPQRTKAQAKKFYESEHESSSIESSENDSPFSMPAESTKLSSSPNSRTRTFSRGWSRHEPVNGIRKMKAQPDRASPGSQTTTDTANPNPQSYNEIKHSTSLADVGSMSSTGRTPVGKELVRQRSLSHEQSPSRPRRQVDVPQGMIRSSSDTNLMASNEKKGSSFAGDHTGPDSRSLNDEMVTVENSDMVQSSQEPTPEDETQDGDSLSGSYVSSYGEYGTLQGGNGKLQESQSSMYFSAPEDLDLDSPLADGPSTEVVLSDEEPGLEEKEPATDSVVSAEEVFSTEDQGQSTFEGGASRYFSESTYHGAGCDSPSLENGDEPDRAVPQDFHFAPVRPEIRVTDHSNNNNVKKGKKNSSKVIKVKPKPNKKTKNNQKKAGEEEVTGTEKSELKPAGQLLDSSLSDVEPTPENSPMGVTLFPGAAQDESSSDYLPAGGETSVNVTAPEDQEVASVTASLTSTITDSTSVASVDSNSQVPYHILDRSGDSSSIGGDFNISKGSSDNKSDTDVLLRITQSRSPSPTGSKTSHRTDSRPATPVTNGGPEHVQGEEEHPRHVRERNGSPVPDRMSLHLDDMEHLPNDHGGGLEVEQEGPEDMRSVLAGGVVVGWTADVAVILWRRMIGALGDINSIQDPEIHARVYECLCDLVDTMLKMRDNMAVSKDNQTSPPPPELLPPLSVFIPWLFEALSRPREFKRGKLLAYRLLCMATVRCHDMLLPMTHLSRFYRVLHHGLVHTDQDTTNTLVRHCGPRFFSLPLPGSTMMILDFVHAANTIASTTDLKEAPRAEAVSILGSLICFPNHFGELPVLQPNAVDMTIMQCNDVKDHVIGMLLKAGKKEPSSAARFIAISCVGIFLYEELTHHSMHPRLKEAINVLLAILRFNNKCVAQVAADMLMLLCDHCETLLKEQPDVPRRIIEVIATVISTLLPSTENSNSEDDKRLLVSVMFVLLEWCMRVPLSMLLEAPAGSKSLIYKTFKVLNMVVTGTAGTLTPRGHVANQEFIGPEEELENLRESHSNPTSPRAQLDVLSDYANKARRSPTSQLEAGEKDILKLAAKTVMCQLVNHLGHFPMGGGASQLNSEVQEHHDISHVSLDELSEEIFHAPGVQFFVVNNSTLVSFVEIPALTGVPGGGVTAGLTTGKTVTRIIIRDAAGKFCWDSTVLYGPPRCRAGSYPAAPQTVLRIIEDIDLLGREPAETEQENEEQPPAENAVDVPRQPSLPLFKMGWSTDENLDQLLDYIGQTSPECLLHPGEPLNIPDRPPEELTVSTESTTCNVVTKQKERERDYYDRHKNDSSMVARALEPMEDRDPSSPFQLCRLYLNQLGLMQWCKRPHFDLLKKDGKLLRELKNLDNHKCRETHKIAVIYVAEGQEDKQSILTNTAGSSDYEHFVSGLGWEVDLETHSGFMGGLQHNKSTGDTAPYYATSTREVIFHVSTRMPSATPEDRHRKLRHLGNDEVQIIWSEHTRDYRRGIISTDFADVLLVIYPLQNGLFRIQINRKPEVPYFGPLFDGAIVDRAILSGLVRATAINAGHLMRSQRTFYQAFYEERAKYVENVVQHQRETTTFEEFAAQVFAPLLPHGGDMIGAFSNSDLLQMHPGHFGTGENEAGKGSADKMSPQTSVKVAKGDAPDSSGSAFSRRLSFGKSRKASNKQAAPPPPGVTPPDSPNQIIKTKK